MPTLALHPNVINSGSKSAAASSPKSMRRAAALAANPLPYVARMVTTNAAGDITIVREDGTTDTVYCVAGHNAYRFVRITADAGTIVQDVHF